jgi:hypothetical protein
MSNEQLPNGPDKDELIQLIRERWPDAAVATIESAAFFSLDETHWPNFATVVWTDEIRPMPSSTGSFRTPSMRSSAGSQF